MERLTERLNDGYTIMDCKNCELNSLQKCTALACRNRIKDRLADYEDIGLEPERLREFMAKWACRPGDTLYRIDLDPQVTEKVVTPLVVDNIVICANGEVLLKYDSYDGVICTLDSLVNGTRYLDYYRTFLTREEAQRTLEGANGDG